MGTKLCQSRFFCQFAVRIVGDNVGNFDARLVKVLPGRNHGHFFAIGNVAHFFRTIGAGSFSIIIVHEFYYSGHYRHHVVAGTGRAVRIDVYLRGILHDHWHFDPHGAELFDGGFGVQYVTWPFLGAVGTHGRQL